MTVVERPARVRGIPGSFVAGMAHPEGGPLHRWRGPTERPDGGAQRVEAGPFAGSEALDREGLEEALREGLAGRPADATEEGVDLPEGAAVPAVASGARGARGRRGGRMPRKSRRGRRIRGARRTRREEDGGGVPGEVDAAGHPGADAAGDHQGDRRHAVGAGPDRGEVPGLGRCPWPGMRPGRRPRHPARPSPCGGSKRRSGRPSSGGAGVNDSVSPTGSGTAPARQAARAAAIASTEECR